MKYLLEKDLPLLVLFFLLLGCYDEGRLIEITVPPTAPRLVIHSVIYPAGALQRVSPLGFKVSSTAHIFDKGADLITDAVVRLYKKDQFFGTLEYIDSLGYYPLNDSPDYNDDYRIEVSKEGFLRANAIVAVPSAIEIDTVIITPMAYFDEENYVFSEVEIRFRDAPDETNFYEVVVFVTSSFFQPSTDFWPEDFQENTGEALELVAFDRVITEESYYIPKTNINSDYPVSLLFSDNTFNGKKYSLKVYYNPPGRLYIPGDVANHRIRVYLRKVTEETFQFKTAMLEQYNHREEDILYGVGEPINVFSNVENGYGLFGAYSYDSFLLSIEGFIAQ